MPSARCRLAVAAILCGWTAAGCRASPAAETRPSALPPAASSADPGRRKVRTELYFGRGETDGGEVSEAAWAAFLADEVTPLFPAGFTVVDASGQWRNDAGAIGREKSKILIVLHDADVTSAKNLESIRTAYERRFGQASVIRSNQAADVDF
jgi:hypothetical protein